MKEEFAIVLDYLPHGYPLSKKRLPIIQAVGIKHFTLLELVPRKEEAVESKEKVYIGEGKRDKISYILKRLDKEDITESAKQHLEETISELVKEREDFFVNFFNKADAINKRTHQIELLPGMGKKFMIEILSKRDEKPFESFNDIKQRVSNLPFPEKAIEKRIFQELINKERYNLFVN